MGGCQSKDSIVTESPPVDSSIRSALDTSKPIKASSSSSPSSHKHKNEINVISNKEANDEKVCIPEPNKKDDDVLSNGTAGSTRSLGRCGRHDIEDDGWSSGNSAASIEDVRMLDTSMHRRRKNSSSLRPSVSTVGLDEIIENRKEEGALTSNVVNIEVPFGKPIEEVYDGVHTGDILGSGVSGLVRKVTHRATGIQYAVKCLDLGLLETEESLEQLRQEIFIMCQLDHPGVVRLEEVYESTSEIYLVQELCHGGELFDRLDDQPDYHYTEQQCARLVKQMLCAVRYIHTKEIIHRDLKLENFLFTTVEATAQLKMIDFGLSKHFKFGEVQHEAVGTPYTVAPEVIRGNYDERCDIWAIGVITYLLLSGEPPFGGCGGPEPLTTVRSNILEGSFFFEPPEIWDNVSNDAKSFIKSLLVTDPLKRPTAVEAQNSTWLVKWAIEETRNNGGNILSANVVNALVTFKEYSDMRKLLCEVLSFTLVPDQIQELRKEFEKMDVDGSGEISFAALKTVLLESAGSGSLGALTEDEVEDIFNAMRVRKTETKVHWHEFIAAGLSQCKVDDRNLRLAFDRLDKTHKGYINFDDILDIMGSDGYGEEAEESYRKMFIDGLQDLRSKDSIITYEDFLLLMKGQCREPMPLPKHNPMAHMNKLISVPETQPLPERIDEELPEQVEDEEEPQLQPYIGRFRSKSFEVGDNGEEYDENAHIVAPTNALRSINLPEYGHDDEKIEELINDESKTPLQVNRGLYRAHRQMRLSVLETCKRFEDMEFSRLQKEHQQKQNDAPVGGAGLVMSHRCAERLSTEAIREILQKRQKEQQLLLEKANKISGRGGSSRRRDRRKKTVSDMSAMLASNNNSTTSPDASTKNKAQTPSPSQKNLLVHNSTTTHKLSADSRSCPPSPAIEALQSQPFAPNPSKSLPFLPNMSLEGGNDSSMSLSSGGIMIEPEEMIMNDNLIFRSTPELKSSLKDHLENLPLREEDESMNESNGLTEELALSLKSHLENQFSSLK